jgi:hypothetical protein
MAKSSSPLEGAIDDLLFRLQADQPGVLLLKPRLRDHLLFQVRSGVGDFQDVVAPLVPEVRS